jgi:hypothetical protein
LQKDPVALVDQAGDVVGREFLKATLRKLGPDKYEHFALWITNTWDELHGPSWDWFAYEFAFGRWAAPGRTPEPGVFDLGNESLSIAAAYEQLVRMRYRAFRALVARIRESEVSPWDSRIMQSTRTTLRPEAPGSRQGYSEVAFESSLL